MASIEDRIVQMEFDNGAFERRLAETIRSLERLNTTLGTMGARNGLETVAASARSFNLAPVSSAVEGISAKFLALSTIGVTALATITHAALNAGAALAKNLGLEEVVSGFHEYELQIGSIQTILANTSADGTNLEQVTAALDQLNTYADQTIYNFGEMTRNIGTFTAAGVDLDLSVQAIKGIANLAAISGSNSQQASTAMYQLSQAISTGSVRLMDWNSVVNAGMGGEVFQRALFETGVAMGTIVDAPVGTSFEDWTAAGNSFRGSLESGWLSAEVLTTTLQAFTGEMTEAQLTAIGYTQEQAQEMVRLGEMGVDAATKVRTLSQLIGTVKESIGSGWAQSFRLMFGDFEDATNLFSGLQEDLSNFFGGRADRRNQMLEQFVELGGRSRVLSAIGEALKRVRDIAEPLGRAFRDIFPPLTAERLFQLVDRFHVFLETLKPTVPTVEKLRLIFTGFFAALEIGWEVLKEGIKFVFEFLKALSGAGDGGFLNFLTKIARHLTDLNTRLVSAGGIMFFFDDLSAAAQAVTKFIRGTITAVIEFFKNLRSPSAEIAGSAFDRLKARLGGLFTVFERLGGIWEPLSRAIRAIVPILDEAWDAISSWFTELGHRIADSFGPGEFDSMLDAINTGLLGGIVLMLRRFFSNGINLDFGGGVLGSISESFDQLTGVLSAMQTQLKADALLKIAGAIGILTLSLILLSTINSGALTSALAAMAVGFGQLIGAFTLLNKIVEGPTAAAKLTLLAGGLVLLATSMLILAGAVKILSSLSWGELVKGLIGVVVLLGAISGAVLIMSQASGGLIRAGLAMIAVAIAMNLLATAVKKFSDMSWGEIAKGLAGVAGGLVILATAMNFLPSGTFARGTGLLLTATALIILAEAVEKFANMDWGEMGKGLAGVGGGLLIIAGAMQLMPASMPFIGAGLLLVSASLLIIARALKSFASISWGDLGRGLAGMAASLLLLAAATSAMSGTIGGAIAIGIVSASLLLLVRAIKKFGEMNLRTLIQGLLSLAAVLGIMAVAAIVIGPLAPALLALGVAMLALSAAFALFGIGAISVAKAFQIIAQAGHAAVGVLIEIIDAVIQKIPELIKSFAEGLIALVDVFISAAPSLVEGFGAIIGSILDAVTELIPKIAETVRTLIGTFLTTARELFPDIVQTGFDLLLSFLQGIRDNIGEIVIVVADIITNFLDALALKIPEIIDSVYNFLMAVIKGVVVKLGDVSGHLLPKGVELIFGLLKGIQQKLPEVITFFTTLPGRIFGWIGQLGSFLLRKGVDLIQGLYNGANNILIGTVAPWFRSLPGKVFSWIGNTIATLTYRGWSLIVGFYNGVIDFATSNVAPWFRSLPSKVFSWIGSVFTTLADKGFGIIAGFYNGVINFVNSDLAPWFANIGNKIFSWIPPLGGLLKGIGRSIIQGLLDGMVEVWEKLKGFVGGIGGWISSHKGPPEKDAVLLYHNGQLIFRGLHRGMKDEWGLAQKWLAGVDPAGSMRNDLASRMSAFLGDVANQFDDMDIRPTITPVLDLTEFQNEAQRLGGLISANTSYGQAIGIASTSRSSDESANSESLRSPEAKFVQIINAPTQLSTAEIYRQTRSQIEMAKHDLGIPA